MKKITFCLRRRSDLTLEAFHQYWREVHAPLVRKRAQLLGIRRYTQVQTIQDDWLHDRLRGRNGGAPAPFDGFAEIWYDETWPNTTRDDSFRRAAQELLDDERNFIDLAQSPMTLGRAWVGFEDHGFEEAGGLEAALLGTWALDSWTINYGDGRPVRYPFGRNPHGRLLYAGGGYMSVTVMEQRASSANTLVSLRANSTEEKLRIYDGLFHYSGMYEVRQSEVIHRIDISSNTSLVGSVQRRAASLQKNLLTLTAVDEGKEGRRTHSLVWRREAPRST